VRERLVPELRYRGFKRALLSAVRNLPIHRGEDLYRRVDASGLPVQLVWGRQDPVTPMPPESRVHEVFSNADIRLLDGVGHLPHWERPGETARNPPGVSQRAGLSTLRTHDAGRGETLTPCRG
jgi:pimeloyl-ACP methyl ester carboxylesterase